MFDAESNSFNIVPSKLDHMNSKTKSLYKNDKYPPGSFFIEPTDQRFTKPVAILIGARQISSGEGIALMLQRLPQCKTVGLYASHGSFGTTTNLMLDETEKNQLVVIFPMGQSLDSENNIQIDSDDQMNGGVLPDIKVPLTDESAKKMYNDNIDIELESAINFLDEVVSVKENQSSCSVINDFKLYQNYPNPFNPNTQIRYFIPKAGQYYIKVYNAIGKEIKTITNSYLSSGNYTTTFNGTKLSSGIYIYRLIGNNINLSKKMTLIK